MSNQPSPDFIAEYTQGMSEDYLAQHGPESIARHARIAAARRSELVRVEVDPNESGGIVYFVADDRSGLLAGASGALLASNLSIENGEFWLRSTPTGRTETLGIFQVHPEDERLVNAERALEIQDKFQAILDGRARPPEPIVYPTRPGTETRVRFLESPSGGLSVLEVQTRDRSGLLAALTHALFERRVQIVEAQVRTDAGEVHDRFSIVELDGSPIEGSRRLDIQVAILTAVDAAQH